MESKAAAGVIINELTVKDIYEWLSEFVSHETSAAATDHANIVDAYLLDGIALSDLRRMTNLTSKQMETMTPETLQRIALECKQVNRHFFQLRVMVTTGVRPAPETSLNGSDSSSPE